MRIEDARSVEKWKTKSMLDIIGLEHSAVYAKIAITNTRSMERHGSILKKFASRQSKAIIQGSAVAESASCWG